MQVSVGGFTGGHHRAVYPGLGCRPCCGMPAWGSLACAAWRRITLGLLLRRAASSRFRGTIRRGTGLEVADGTALFTVYFDAIGAAGSVSPVAFGDSPTVREATVDLVPRAFASRDGAGHCGGREAGDLVRRGCGQGHFPHLGAERQGPALHPGVFRFLVRRPIGGPWGSVVGDGSVKALRDPNATTQQRFYRVRVE